jgi:four helix bundle protein
MSKIQSYKDLLIWQKGMEIVLQSYKLVSDFPKEELYALVDQIKRDAVSVPSNIAEGNGRSSTQSYSHFIKISRGSLFELETQLIIAKDLQFVKNDKIFSDLLFLIEEESKMINSFINKLDSVNGKLMPIA